jgi:hypothetical protein
MRRFLLDENRRIVLNISMKMASMLYGFKSEHVKMTLVITCLGYSKISKLITVVSQLQNFVLEKKVESLKEVIVEASKKLERARYNYYKTTSFTKTEQSLEDVLKKLRY